MTTGMELAVASKFDRVCARFISITFFYRPARFIGFTVSESSMARAHWNGCISVKWALFVWHVGSLESPKPQLSIGV